MSMNNSMETFLLKNLKTTSLRMWKLAKFILKRYLWNKRYYVQSTDPTALVYDEDGITVYFSRNYEYVDICGLSKQEESEFETTFRMIEMLRKKQCRQHQQ